MTDITKAVRVDAWKDIANKMHSTQAQAEAASEYWLDKQRKDRLMQKYKYLFCDKHSRGDVRIRDFIRDGIIEKGYIIIEEHELEQHAAYRNRDLQRFVDKSQKKLDMLMSAARGVLRAWQFDKEHMPYSIGKLERASGIKKEDTHTHD